MAGYPGGRIDFDVVDRGDKLTYWQCFIKCLQIKYLQVSDRPAQWNRLAWDVGTVPEANAHEREEASVKGRQPYPLDCITHYLFHRFRTPSEIPSQCFAAVVKLALTPKSAWLLFKKMHVQWNTDFCLSQGSRRKTCVSVGFSLHRDSSK